MKVKRIELEGRAGHNQKETEMKKNAKKTSRLTLDSQVVAPRTTTHPIQTG